MESSGYTGGNAQNENLEYMADDKMASGQQFQGATLQLDTAARNDNNPAVAFAGMKQQNEPAATNTALNRDRFGSRRSVKSTTSQVSMSASITETPYTAQKYFSKKEGTFENAVEICREDVLKTDVDGDVRGAWMLTEIDHWDNERERIVIICDWSLIVISYNFITNKMNEFRRIQLHVLNEIQMGDFSYPEKSLMRPRDHGGVKLAWGDQGKLSFGQKWNPYCSDIPFTCFTHHPLIYNESDKETVTYNVDDFYESLLTATKNAYRAKMPDKSITIIEAPILIESYANLGSMIFNQSHIGFNRDRSGLCF